MNGLLFQFSVTFNRYLLKTCGRFLRCHGTSVKGLGIVLERFAQLCNKLLVVEILGPVGLDQVIKLFLDQRVTDRYILCACKAVPCLDVVLAPHW